MTGFKGAKRPNEPTKNGSNGGGKPLHFVPPIVDSITKGVKTGESGGSSSPEIRERARTLLDDIIRSIRREREEENKKG